jgi:long-chain acyl-CoA synthetase
VEQWLEPWQRLGDRGRFLSRIVHAMAEYSTLPGLVDGFSARGETPAIVSVRDETLESWSYARLAETTKRVAAGLVEAGVAQGETVAILAPNRPEWAVCYFAIVTAGALAVPLDEQMAEADLAAAMADSGCRWVFTTRDHVPRLRSLEGGERLELILLDGGAESLGEAPFWHSLLADEIGVLPETRAEDPASLLYTSGTTGAPKGVPLSHGNFIANLKAFLTEGLVGDGDRVVLPLPLHHAYPFTLGLLATLALGATLVLPASVSGPEIVRALRLTRATAMVGVPRLYAAMVAGIEARATAPGGLTAAAFRLLLALSIWIKRRLGLRLGRILFRRLHAQVAPTLGLLGSGGAQLDPELESKLGGLGWEVLTGYGLTETAPILTFNPRRRARIGSAGLPIPGVELRIRAEPGRDDGEVQARGPNVFAGYRNNPEATRAAFTEDGWFRTGDLGVLDADGYLYIVGRSKELIVLADGKNIVPEEVEATYAKSPFIREAALLESGGLLVGVLLPDADAIRTRGETRVDTLLREEVKAISLTLPSHQRLSGFAIAREPLPRTHLGKLKRFLLPELYAGAKEGAGPARPAVLSEEDQALIGDPRAKRIWDWLVARYPDKTVTLDSNLQLDLGIDSLEWVSLTLEVQERFGANLTEDAVERTTAVRDLLKETLEAAAAGPVARDERAGGVAALTPEQARWIEPPGPVFVLLGLILYGLNWVFMHSLFRLRIEGLERLPPTGPLVLTPNHTSFLDAFAVVAALSWRRLRRTYWAGWAGILFAGPLARLFSRITQIFPVDPYRSPAASLAYGMAVLARKMGLVWFPEGRRSPSGQLLPFLPGIGILVKNSGAPAVPVLIRGTFEAFPVGRRLPRPGAITVVFGPALSAEELEAAGEGEDPPTRIANALHDAVARLSESEGLPSP